MNISMYNKVFAYRRMPRLHFVRLPHKLSKKTDELDPKVAPDIIKYLKSNSEYSELFDRIPKQLLKKYKTPESMYLINKKSASEISNVLAKNLNKSSPVVEVNPGFCYLTKELLKSQKKIYTYETSTQFNEFTKEINLSYGNRVISKTADFFGMWKMAFQDKMDQGNRVKELLGELASEDPDRILQIVGAMPGLSFMKYLLTMILFHNTNNLLGRPDLYIIMPGHHYEFLTDKQIQHSKHRSLPAQFQLLFDYKVLGKVLKLHYLPWILPSASKNVSIIDEHYMYIVNIRQKEKLPCQAEYLPLLWYFFKPHMIIKTARVIPALEQWIPGCGVWLITGQDPPDTNMKLAPTETDVKLPHMTIFTEFGDLNLQQKLTLFKRFISWPEFEQCPFKVTMENNLPKFITALETDGKYRTSTHVQDDTLHEDSSDSDD